MACPAGTVVTGIPIGPPSQVPDPKSACTAALAPMLATSVEEFEATGSLETSACHTLSAGKIEHAAGAAGEDVRTGDGLGDGSGARRTAPDTAGDGDDADGMVIGPSPAAGFDPAAAEQAVRARIGTMTGTSRAGRIGAVYGLSQSRVC
ncbi:hypothetical protein Raf01_60510 [Rugosimonospora africana]|uniref:Uncharacterized protein n=1 Tax=Rugosimonospora africana TaxID=556532 RepID=A0A8J3QWY6_9ACTN|nr:hypothetical protein Raf01_60510 [Rugosimonospora africana]